MPPVACKLTLGMFTTIAVVGCGADRGRPIVQGPGVSRTLVPSEIETGERPGAPIAKADDAPRGMPGFRRKFDAPLRFPAESTGDPELDPLVSYLKAAFAYPLKTGRRLVIDDMTDVGQLHFREPYQSLVDRLMESASDKLPAELLKDFCDKNRQARAVWPELSRRLPADLLTERERKDLFSALPDDGWKRFRSKYPTAYGILTVSRIGLNRDRTMAVFYLAIGEGPVSGYGQIHVLKKEGDTWMELPIDLTSWIS